MKHVGEIIKKHIEDNHLKKREIADKVGITYNYLSTIFKQPSISCDLLEKICLAIGLHPAVVFDIPDDMKNHYHDIWANAILGSAQVQINANDKLQDLLAEKDRLIAEKERTIQILMKAAGMSEPGQIRDNNDK